MNETKSETNTHTGTHRHIQARAHTPCTVATHRPRALLPAQRAPITDEKISDHRRALSTPSPPRPPLSPTSAAAAPPPGSSQPQTPLHGGVRLGGDPWSGAGHVVIPGVNVYSQKSQGSIDRRIDDFCYVVLAVES